MSLMSGRQVKQRKLILRRLVTLCATPLLGRSNSAKGQPILDLGHLGGDLGASLSLDNRLGHGQVVTLELGLARHGDPKPAI